MSENARTKLSAAQRRILSRLADGDKISSRLNFMFCEPSSRYVKVFHSDLSVAPANTINALFKAGYLGPGYYVTDLGHAALSTLRRSCLNHVPSKNRELYT